MARPMRLMGRPRTEGISNDAARTSTQPGPRRRYFLHSHDRLRPVTTRVLDAALRAFTRSPCSVADTARDAAFASSSGRSSMRGWKSLTVFLVLAFAAGAVGSLALPDAL